MNDFQKKEVEGDKDIKNYHTDLKSLSTHGKTGYYPKSLNDLPLQLLRCMRYSKLLNLPLLHSSLSYFGNSLFLLITTLQPPSDS